MMRPGAPGIGRFSPRAWIVVGVFALATIAGGVTWGVVASSASDKSDAFPAAAAAATAAGDTVAARVNGVDVPLRTVNTLEIMGSTFAPPSSELSNREGVLNAVIRAELLRQERERRGLRPSQDQVTALVLDQQRINIDMRKAGTLSPDAKAVLDGYEKIGHPVETWPEDPFILGMFAATIGETMLQDDETKDIPETAPNRLELVLERMDKLVERLRSEATIEILVK